MRRIRRRNSIEGLLNPAVKGQAAEYARRFQSAQPFRHVVIDDFFAADFCRDVCAQFPAFDGQAAINENGEPGGKAVQENVRGLGPAYRALDDLVRSAEFRALVGRIAGIPDLRYDPHYFGGGTHENRHGQELDAHIDFNYHPFSRQHRRLNLIVYLNEEWNDAWGGSIQLHRDPYRDPRADEIVKVRPELNRCVIFETNEHSWHGFERIDLPADKRHLSRRSFALYYYTDTRPPEETAGAHSTVYVERHLPEHIREGRVLTAEDMAEIRRLLDRRDQHLKRLYAQIHGLGTRLAKARDGSLLQAVKRRVHDFETLTTWRVTASLRALKKRLSGRS